MLSVLLARASLLIVAEATAAALPLKGSPRRHADKIMRLRIAFNIRGGFQDPKGILQNASC